jgi:hypothetical protein
LAEQYAWMPVSEGPRPAPELMLTNTTAAGTLHPRRYCPAQPEGGTDIDRENAVPIGVPHFLDRAGHGDWVVKPAGHQMGSDRGS